jgi:hypothetical protein
MKKFLPTNQSDLQRMVWEMINEKTKMEYRFGNFGNTLFNMGDLPVAVSNHPNTDVEK